MNQTLLGSIVEVQSVAHFLAGFQNRLLVVHLRDFFFGLRNFQIGNQFAVIENRLGQRSQSLEHKLPRIRNLDTRTIRPARRSRDVDTRIEGGTSLVRRIISTCQRHLGNLHVRTVFQQLQGNTRCQIFRHHLRIQRPTFDMLRSLGQEDREGVFSFSHLTLEVDQRSLNLMIDGTALGDGSFCCHTGNLHRLHGPDIFLVDSHILCCDFNLTVEHQQSIIGISNTTNNLRTHRLTRELALEKGSPLATACI